MTSRPWHCSSVALVVTCACAASAPSSRSVPAQPPAAPAWVDIDAYGPRVSDWLAANGISASDVPAENCKDVLATRAGLLRCEPAEPLGDNLEQTRMVLFAARKGKLVRVLDLPYAIADLGTAKLREDRQQTESFLLRLQVRVSVDAQRADVSDDPEVSCAYAAAVIRLPRVKIQAAFLGAPQPVDPSRVHGYLQTIADICSWRGSYAFDGTVLAKR